MCETYFCATVKDSGRRKPCETCEQLWDWMLVWLKALQAPFGLCSDVWLSQQLQDNNALWHCRNIPVSELMSTDKTHTHTHKTHAYGANTHHEGLMCEQTCSEDDGFLEILGWLLNALDDSGIDVIQMGKKRTPFSLNTSLHLLHYTVHLSLFCICVCAVAAGGF